jgi:hypothetical protein
VRYQAALRPVSTRLAKTGKVYCPISWSKMQPLVFLQPFRWDKWGGRFLACLALCRKQGRPLLVSQSRRTRSREVCSSATTVISVSTKREPWVLYVPQLPLRHSTPGPIARSAALFCGSTPSRGTHVHNTGRNLRLARQTPSVFEVSHVPPASSHCSTSRRSGRLTLRKRDRCSGPSRTRCHQENR